MLLPALKSARDKAKQAGCIHNLKQIGLAIHVYANDYDGYAPSLDSSTRRWGGGWYVYSGTVWDGTKRVNLGKIYPNYLTDSNIFICPADKRQGIGAWVSSYNYRDSHIAWNKGIPVRIDNYPNYGLVVDIFWEFNMGVNSFHGGNLRNALYADGSVKSVRVSVPTFDDNDIYGGFLIIDAAY